MGSPPQKGKGTLARSSVGGTWHAASTWEPAVTWPVCSSRAHGSKLKARSSALPWAARTIAAWATRLERGTALTGAESWERAVWSWGPAALAAHCLVEQVARGSELGFRSHMRGTGLVGPWSNIWLGSAVRRGSSGPRSGGRHAAGSWGPAV